MRQYYSLLKYGFSTRIAYSGLRLKCVGLKTQFISAPSKGLFTRTLFYYSLFVIVLTFAYYLGFLIQYYNQECGDTHFGVFNRSLLKYFFWKRKNIQFSIRCADVRIQVL
jgi:hypothetical protein